MKFLSTILAGLLAISFHDVVAASRRAVSVQIVPAKIVRRTFDPQRPPADMPKLVPPEVGQCVYEFGCEMETRTERPALPVGAPRARVTATSITARLHITLWTPRGGPPAIVEHEEAHREICEIYYRPAAEIARRLGNRMVGTTLPLTSRSQAAAEAALRDFQDRFIKEFLRETLTRCSFAQERFDALTHHSRASVDVRGAIAQAVADEAARRSEHTRVAADHDSPPPARAAPPPARKRFPPTRPRS